MDAVKPSAAERVRAAGYEDVVLLVNFSYDDALVGVTLDGRAVYDYDKMVSWLMETRGYTVDEAVDLVDTNTLRSIEHPGPDRPIIMYPLTT